MVGYLFDVAYVLSGITYWTALAAGLLERLPCNFRTITWSSPPHFCSDF